MEAFEKCCRSESEWRQTEYRASDLGRKKQKLLSDEFVKITTKDQIIYGDGFEANEDFTKYKIFKTRGTILSTQTHMLRILKYPG